MDIPKMLNGLDLFSGIGGLSIALKQWIRPIAYCEIDTYCQGVLLSRMSSGSLCYAPIWDDVRTLEFRDSDRLAIDILYGGFPCQDISIAGRGKGLEGERSGLFFEIIRLAKEIKPKFIFLENVPAITSRGGLRIVKEVAEMGYDCRWCVISAASIGALHKRERWFLLAYSTSMRCDKRTSETIYSQWKTEQHEKSSNTCSQVFNFWENNESPLCGMANGIPYRVDQIRALGNAVVPQQAKEAFKILIGFKWQQYKNEEQETARSATKCKCI